MARVVLLTRTSCTLEGGLYLFCSYFGGFFFPPPSKPPTAYLVDSANPNRLRLRSFAPRICSYPVDSRPVPRPRRV